MSETQTQKKISYYVKEETRCPICEHQFQKEEMLFGRGRLIARDINAELRRTDDANPKFGKVFPAAYTLIVCPNCWSSGLPRDFENILPESIMLVRDLIDYRRKVIQDIFSPDQPDAGTTSGRSPS